MTVEEATKNWCPILNKAQTCPCFCVADTCMAWRWFDPAVKNDGYCGLAGKEGAE